jgi:hypothetical protein
MHARAAHLVTSLGLVPHPEGGWFREIYRAGAEVRPADGRGPRPALTTIYFLLAGGQVSRWHRVASDEVWHYYEGDPIEIFTADAAFENVTRHELAPAGETGRPVHVVPPRVWQAARSTGAYTLVGCTVGPGFDLADFEMLTDQPVARDAASRRHPELAYFIQP